MAAEPETRGRRQINLSRIAVWAVLGGLMLLPWVAMRFTREVVWTPTDFVAFGGLLTGVGLAFELAAWKANGLISLAAFGVAILGGFLTVWVSMAVGLIGDQDNAVNLFYGGVLVLGIIGAVISRLESAGMARTMLVMTVAQAAVGGLVLISGRGEPLETGLSTGFAVFWLISAALFGLAARREAAVASNRA